jgi:hypothetical protein
MKTTNKTLIGQNVSEWRKLTVRERAQVIVSLQQNHDDLSFEVQNLGNAELRVALVTVQYMVTLAECYMTTDVVAAMDEVSEEMF